MNKWLRALLRKRIHLKKLLREVKHNLTIFNKKSIKLKAKS